MFVCQDWAAIRLLVISPATWYGTIYLSRTSWVFCGVFSPSLCVRCCNSATLSAQKKKKLSFGFLLRLCLRETRQLLLFSSLYSLRIMLLRCYHCNDEYLQESSPVLEQPSCSEVYASSWGWSSACDFLPRTNRQLNLKAEEVLHLNYKELAPSRLVYKPLMRCQRRAKARRSLWGLWDLCRYP